MNCRETKSLLGAWSDGELEAELASEIQNHVHSCASCRAQVDELNVLSEAVQGDFQAPVPQDLAERAFQAALNFQPAPKSFFDALLPMAWPVAVASSLVALVLMGWILTVHPVVSSDSPDGLDKVLNVSPDEQVEGVLQGALGMYQTGDNNGAAQ